VQVAITQAKKIGNSTQYGAPQMSPFTPWVMANTAPESHFDWSEPEGAEGYERAFSELPQR
jgi:hypothetical protein